MSANRPHSPADESHHDHMAQQEARALREELDESVREATRAQLIADCRERGSIASGALLDFVAEFGPTTAESFVAICESCWTELFEDAYETLMAESKQAETEQ